MLNCSGSEVEFVSADADKELIRLMATLGLPTTFGTSLEVILCYNFDLLQNIVNFKINVCF